MLGRLLSRRGLGNVEWHETESGYLFGHCLLPIRGATPHLQPIVDRGGVVLFTGEFWDVSKGESDTLSIVRDLSVYSFEDAMRRRDGIWAIVYWQQNEDIVWFSTDPIGEQPMHYVVQDGHLSIASEVKSLVAAGYNLSAIKPVEPSVTYRFQGHVLSKRIAAQRTVRQLTGFRRESVRKKIGRAVERLAGASDLQSVAVLFSGGIDSTIVGYEAAKVGIRRAYTIATSMESIDAQRASAAASRLGLDLTVLISEPASPAVAVACGEVSNRSIVEELCMHVHMAAELNRLGVRVLLTGCGADELFVGYNHLLGRVHHSELQHRFLSTYYRYDLRAFNKVYGGYAIEVRNPYLAREVIEYATRIPSRVLLGPKRIMKWPLRSSYKDVLAEAADRPKLIARETMGAKQCFLKQFGESPYVYKKLWREVLGTMAGIDSALSAAPS